MRSRAIIMALAVLTLLVLPYTPHHHHAGALCTMVEHCDEDGIDNDEHTGHNGDGTSCIEDEGFMASPSGTSDSNTVPPLFPVLTIPVNTLVSGEMELTRKSVVSGYETALLYQSADVSNAHTLRAPPYTVL